MELPATYFDGIITIEQIPKKKAFEGNLGIQISGGRVWICLDGTAFIRLRPKYKSEEEEDVQEHGRKG